MTYKDWSVIKPQHSQNKFGIIRPIVVYLKILLMYTLEGVSSVANIITAYEVSIKPRLPFFNP